MTKFSLDQTIFPKEKEERKLTDLVSDGFKDEGPFLVNVKGGNFFVYEQSKDRPTTYILTNGERYLDFLSAKIKRRNKV